MNSENTNRQSNSGARNAHDAVVIFDDSPMAASVAVATLRDLGMSDTQIARYFGTSPLDIKRRLLADQTTLDGA